MIKSSKIIRRKGINKLIFSKLGNNSIFSTSSFSSKAKKELGVLKPGASCITSPLEFPCLEILEERSRALDGGPEPAYDKIVEGYQIFQYDLPFHLDHGGSLPSFQLAYETWGKLNSAKTNAILVHTGLSGSSHAKSQKNSPSPGWWEKFIGPGLSIDTDQFFVICTNVLGGCYGSTGPSSYIPSPKSTYDSPQHSNTKQPERYATSFPLLTIFDMVRSQFLLLDHLGISKLHSSVGASMGGMQSLAAGALFTDRVSRVISISACARSHPYSIALRHVQRQVLMTDPNWNKGFYYGRMPPHIGMKLAREIATITYRSGPEWEQRFGRARENPALPPSLCPDYLIETYLDHQSEKFCLSYDANSLLYISKAMDMFDLSADNLLSLSETSKLVKNRLSNTILDDSLINGLSLLSPISTLILGVQSDILFPCWQQKEIADGLRKSGSKRVHYYELDSLYGHDTFLIDLNAVGPAIKGHLEHSLL